MISATLLSPCLTLSHFVLQSYFLFSPFFIATMEIPIKNKHKCTLSLSLSSVGMCGSTLLVHSVGICSHVAICLSSSEFCPIFWAFPLRCLLFIWELSPAVCKMVMSHSNVSSYSHLHEILTPIKLTSPLSFLYPASLLDLSLHHGNIMWFKVGLIPQKYLRWHTDNTCNKMVYYLKKSKLQKIEMKIQIQYQGGIKYS